MSDTIGHLRGMIHTLSARGFEHEAETCRAAIAEIESGRKRDVGENEGGEGIIKPGDFVNYDGDERLVRRYVGKASNGFDVVEAVPGYSFTTWMPGKMSYREGLVDPASLGGKVEIGVQG